MECGPIKFTMRSTEFDLGALYWNVWDGLDTCSATSYVDTITIGGATGQLSTANIGGCPAARCISAKISSVFTQYQSSSCDDKISRNNYIQAGK